MATTDFSIGDWVLFTPMELNGKEIFIAKIDVVSGKFYKIKTYGSSNLFHNVALRNELKKFEPSRFEILIWNALL